MFCDERKPDLLSNTSKYYTGLEILNVYDELKNDIKGKKNKRDTRWLDLMSLKVFSNLNDPKSGYTFL